MRLALVLSVFVTALTAASAASAIALRQSGGTALSLDRGRGVAWLVDRGSALGRIKRGSIRVTNLPGGSIHVGGWEHRRRTGRRTRVFWGRNLTFSIINGRWRVRLRGRGINVSAVAHGRLALAGRWGTYSIDYSDPQPWPRRKTAFPLD
jgi:hypothetical protein